jgi:stringent starvation protein B
MTTFENPRSKYFTSVTAYDEDRYLMEGVENVNSYTWADNGDGTITVSFNCGETAVNNIDTGGQDFSFTMRYYGVSQQGIVSVRSPGCS